LAEQMEYIPRPRFFRLASTTIESRSVADAAGFSPNASVITQAYPATTRAVSPLAVFEKVDSATPTEFLLIAPWPRRWPLPSRSCDPCPRVAPPTSLIRGDKNPCPPCATLRPLHPTPFLRRTSERANRAPRLQWQAPCGTSPSRRYSAPSSR